MRETGRGGELGTGGGRLRIVNQNQPATTWHWNWNYRRNFGCACSFTTISDIGMNLDSLLVCSDDRALRVLRNVLGELEIHVEHCADHVSAAKKLAQQSFEAVIIDCDDEHSFQLLTRVRSGQQNRKAVALVCIFSC